MDESRISDASLEEPIARGHRRAVALIALGAVVMAAAGAAYLGSSLTAHHGLSASNIRLGDSPVSYPQALPTLSSPAPQRSTGLVRAGATSVLIRQYGGLNAQKPLGLVASLQTNDPAVVSWVVKELNALPAFPTGTFSCPADDGSYFSIVLSYVDGATTPFRVDASGCRAVSVGGPNPIELWAGNSPDLVNTLRALLIHGSGA